MDSVGAAGRDGTAGAFPLIGLTVEVAVTATEVTMEGTAAITEATEVITEVTAVITEAMEVTTAVTAVITEAMEVTTAYSPERSRDLRKRYCSIFNGWRAQAPTAFSHENRPWLASTVQYIGIM
jgi:hypothetical protein